MLSPTVAALIWYTLVLLIPSAWPKVAPLSQEIDCPHQCSCLPELPVRISFICSPSTLNDWEVTRQQIANYSGQAAVIDLKILGNYSSFSGNFLGLPHLRSLDISQTSLLVTGSMFQGLRVDSLNISFNEIKNLVASGFSGLEHLNELDLSHNSISELGPEFLKGLNSLTVLHIGFNNLSALSSETFSYTPSLKYLGLEHNKLQEFSSLYLPRSASLSSLNLRGNILQAISTDLNRTDLSLWRNVSSLDISENPLDCSCALRNLYHLVPDLNTVLVNSPATICLSPEKWKGTGILNVEKSELTCAAPGNMISFPSSSKDILGTTSITLQCHAKGYPRPSIMWITPWKHKFFSGSHLLLASHGLQPDAGEHISTYVEYKESNVFMMSSIRLTANNDLIITNIRGSMTGNYTCLAVNTAGYSSVDISLQVISALKAVVIHSLFMGGYCASGFLIFGFIVGLIKILVVRLKHRLYFIVPMFSKSPSTKHADNASVTQSLDISMSKHDSDDRSSDSSTSDTLLVCSLDSEALEESEKADDLGHSWMSHGFLDSLEEAKGRLRYGVGRKMERVRKNVQSMKESGSVYVQNIVDSSNSAASRMRAGMVFGVETVKYHVQSFKELCGTGDMGAQTISMVSVETDVDSNQRKEVIRQVTFV